MGASKGIYRLIQIDKHGGKSRNENEDKWLREATIPTMTEARWDSVYINLSLLKLNLRIKYQDWRVAWGRQELNRDKTGQLISSFFS